MIFFETLSYVFIFKRKKDTIMKSKEIAEKIVSMFSKEKEETKETKVEETSVDYQSEIDSLKEQVVTLTETIANLSKEEVKEEEVKEKDETLKQLEELKKEIEELKKPAVEIQASKDEEVTTYAQLMRANVERKRKNIGLN